MQIGLGKISQHLILVILFSLPAYLIRFKCGWASFNLVEILIAALFVFWLCGKFIDGGLKNAVKKSPFIKDRIYLTSIVLIISGIALSFLWNKNYYVGLGILKGWFIAPIIFSFMFLDSLAKDKDLLNKSLLALFYSGLAVSVLGVFYKLAGDLTYDSRLRVFYDSPNQLAMYLSPLFVIGLVLFMKEQDLAKKIFYGLGLLIVGFNIYFSFSCGAWLALAVSVAIVFLLLYRKYFLWMAISGLIIILILIISQAGSIKGRNVFSGEGRSSWDSRVMIWRSAALMVKNNPLMGIGPGNFQEAYLEYQEFFSPYLEWSSPQPHNLYLAFWLEAGLLGLIGFLLLLAKFFWDNFKKAINRDRETALICLGIMIYILLHGLVDTTYWKNDLAVTFWAAAAMNLYLAQHRRSSSIA